VTAWYRDRSLAGAASLLGVSVLVSAWTFQRVLASDARSDAVAPAAELSVATIPEREPPAGTLLEETVNHDLFHPERRRPTVAFRRPEEIAAARAAASKPVGPAPPLRLLGTVLSGAKDAFVVCQLGGDTPHIVRVGGSISGYNLRKIEPGRAIFTSPSGETSDLRVTKPGF
jgi:hypothetical protein